MYTLPPLGPLAGAGPLVLAPIAIGGVPGLPNTGMPVLLPAASFGVVLVLAGSMLVLRTAGPAAIRLLLRLGVATAICGYAAALLAVGAVTSAWDVVGLLVAVFTLTYVSLAFRQLLPAYRPEPVRAASPVAARHAGVPQLLPAYR